jgi:hypothetical protein
MGSFKHPEHYKMTAFLQPIRSKIPKLHLNRFEFIKHAWQRTQSAQISGTNGTYVDVRDAHELEELLAVLVVLPGNLDEAAVELVYVLLVAFLFRLRQVFLSLLPPLPPLVELQIGR